MAPVCAYSSRPSSASRAWPAILVYLRSTSLLNPVFFVCVCNIWKPFLRRGVLSLVHVLQLSHSLQEVAILPDSLSRFHSPVTHIKPSAVPYDHRLHVLLTHHFARLFTWLPFAQFKLPVFAVRGWYVSQYFPEVCLEPCPACSLDFPCVGL